MAGERLTPGMRKTLERMLGEEAVSAAGQPEPNDALERRFEALREELHKGLDADRGEIKALREELALTLEKVEGLLSSREGQQENHRESPRSADTPSATGSASEEATATDKPRPKFPKRLYPELVTREPAPDDEEVFGEAWPLIEEWREIWKTGHVGTGKGLAWLETEERVRELEVAMLEEHGLTLPPEKQPLHGPYASAGDLVSRTGLKPQSVLSLVMAGAFDGIAPNRRKALWEAGLHPRPSRNGQMTLSASMEDAVPKLDDFTNHEKMAGEYRAMGLYPRGHLMEFVRPHLRAGILPAGDVETLDDGDEVVVAGWPVARQHPRGREGTVFVTIEDETGDVQIILWPRVFSQCRRELGSNVVEAIGVVSRWDGTTNVIVSDLRAVRTGVAMPPAHDWG